MRPQWAAGHLPLPERGQQVRGVWNPASPFSSSLTASRPAPKLPLNARILVPGGTFLLISLGSPASRLEVFSKAGLNWKVEVILMPKPMLYLKSESSLTGEAGGA